MFHIFSLFGFHLVVCVCCQFPFATLMQLKLNAQLKLIDRDNVFRKREEGASERSFMGMGMGNKHRKFERRNKLCGFNCIQTFMTTWLVLLFHSVVRQSLMSKQHI